MTAFIMNCPQCGQECEVSERLAERALPCPTCGRGLPPAATVATALNFDCPACGQNLEIETADAGIETECPKCSASIRTPARGRPAIALSPGASDPNARPEQKKSSTAKIERLGGAIPTPHARILKIKRPGDAETNPGPR